MKPQVEAALAQVGRITGKKFGDTDESAARLGALGRARLDAGHDGHGAQSRPQRHDRRGARAKAPAIARFAYDSYRRFITMYSDVVLGIEHHHFEEILDEHKDRKGYTLDTDLDGRRLGTRSSRATRRASRRRPAGRFRRIRTSSSGAPSAPCSARG